MAAAEPGGSQWTSAGQNIETTRYQSAEKKIGVGNVAQLGVKWAFTTEGDASATPAVDSSKVYVARLEGQPVCRRSIDWPAGVDDQDLRRHRIAR